MWVINTIKMQAISRILFAWELGANLGHLARDLPVAQQLRALGHDVLFAVKDVHVATQLLKPAGFRFVQAPRPSLPLRIASPPLNYSGILMGAGYFDSTLLSGLINAWMKIFDAYSPDIAVINHAPTALLAARIRDLPAIATCIGFELPPDTDVLPSIRPWEDIPKHRLRQADTLTLQQINGVLCLHGALPLRRVADLFAGVPAILTTLPELDHYGERTNANYVGPISALSNVAERSWPRGGDTRVFAYLRPSVPGLEPLLAALRETDTSVLCVAPGISHEVANRFASPSFEIVTQPIALGAVLKDADLAVVYGTGTMADALLAGVPLLMVPQVVEQALAARRIEALGAGILWAPPRTPESARSVLARALDSPALRHNAQQFAHRHREHTPDRAISDIADAILGTIARTIDRPHRIDETKISRLP
ncbi:glycosyltransferase [Ralstonia syzygii]|uniref:Putative glycosyl transferase n=1 Tax=Ralstonia syzygii R24 TaxID=907261 RepID=G3A721_9RALS|nr:nucleotide disphospho-sugar-binding domain-containing protein [Ralstonia syzygii]CCA86279.1 putative glycosyl transferase [Ralstonia syzygii R24]